MTRDAIERRAAMRRRLAEWGRVAPDIQHERVRAARRYEQAREEYERAKARREHAPEDGKVRTALDGAILHAQAEAEAYEKAYAREVKRTIAAEEKRAAMDAKVGRLNAREKQVLHLRYGREMSWTAVARRCYISVSAARWCERGAVDRLIRMDEQ